MPLQIHEKIFVGKKEQLTLENVGKLKVDQIFVNTDEMFKIISEGPIGQEDSKFSKFEISDDSLMEGFDPEKRSLIICETCKTNSLIFAAKLLTKFYGLTSRKSIETIRTTKSQTIFGSDQLTLLKI